MEGIKNNKDGSVCGAFAHRAHGAGLSGAGEIVSPKARRALSSSQFAAYEPRMMVESDRGGAGFSRLPEEQLFASDYADMIFMNQRAGYPTKPRNVVSMNGYCPSGSVDHCARSSPAGVPLHRLLVPTVVEDDLVPLQFSAEHDSQKTNQVTLENQEAHCFPLHNGSFPRSSSMHTMDSVCGGPYKLSAPSASPIWQQFCMDGKAQTYAPCDQQPGSDFILQHCMDAKSYPVMQPHHVYPQLQQATTASDVHRMRSCQQATVCASANGRSYIGTPNVHKLGLVSDDLYSNGDVFHKINSQLNSAFGNKLTSTLYTGSSCGSGCFCQKAEKFAHPYEPNRLLNGFMHHQISNKVSTANYLANIYTKSDAVNVSRNTKFGPSMARTDSDGHNNFDIRSNESSHLGSLNFKFSSLVMESPEINYDSVDGFAGRIYTLAKDHNGCHFLQKVFAEGTQEDVEKVFAEIIVHIGELMKHPVGSYLVQKLLERCSDDQLMRVICEVTKVPGELIGVACNTHGTRAVQKIVEAINAADQASKVASALSPGAKRLMFDANGSRVANLCLQKLLPEYKAFLFDAATAHYLQLATDREGCRILQQCIEQSNDEQKNSLLSNITSSALHLSDDPYGNFVIQSILNDNIVWATDRIVDDLAGHFGYLSMKKCGSHVVENCLNRAPERKRERIIDELMRDPRLRHIMLNQYGNFVIQTALAHCKGELYKSFVEVIRPHAPALQSSMYGKRVLSKTYLQNKPCRGGIR